MTEFQKQVKNLIEKGYTESAVSRELKHPTSSICSAIKALNLTVLSREYINTVDNDFFNKIDTDDKAYYLGFFIADGNLTYTKGSIGRFGFLIQEGDRYLLDNLKKLINCPNNVKCNNPS